MNLTVLPHAMQKNKYSKLQQFCMATCMYALAAVNVKAYLSENDRQRQEGINSKMFTVISLHTFCANV